MLLAPHTKTAANLLVTAQHQSNCTATLQPGAGGPYIGSRERSRTSAEQVPATPPQENFPQRHLQLSAPQPHAHPVRTQALSLSSSCPTVPSSLPACRLQSTVCPQAAPAARRGCTASWHLRHPLWRCASSHPPRSACAGSRVCT